MEVVGNIGSEAEADKRRKGIRIGMPRVLNMYSTAPFFRAYAATPNFTGDPSNNFVQGRPTTNNSNGYQVRIDHRFGDSDNVFFRFTEQRVSVFSPIGDAGSTGGSSAAIVIEGRPAPASGDEHTPAR